MNNFVNQESKLLRIFVGERDKFKNTPLFEKIVLLARENKIAGATAIKGVLGYGATCVLHFSKILELSSDLPMIIEIVDSQDKIDGFIPILNKLVEEVNCGIFITLENVSVLKYRAGSD